MAAERGSRVAVFGQPLPSGTLFISDNGLCPMTNSLARFGFSLKKKFRRFHVLDSDDHSFRVTRTWIV